MNITVTMHQLFSVLHFKLYSQKKKETMGWNEVDNSYNIQHINMKFKREKRKRSDLVLWQKPLHPQKNPKSNVTTQKKNATKNFPIHTFHHHNLLDITCVISIFLCKHLLTPLLQNRNMQKLIFCKMLVLIASDTKTLYFCSLLRNNNDTPSRKISFCEKKQHASELWSTLVLFGRFHLFKILVISRKSIPSAPNHTKETSFSIKRKAVYGD